MDGKVLLNEFFPNKIVSKNLKAIVILTGYYLHTSVFGADIFNQVDKKH